MWIFFRTKINWNNGDKTINNKNFRNLIFRRRKKVYFSSLRSRHSSSAFATNPADKQLYAWVEKGRAHTFILAYYWDMCLMRAWSSAREGSQILSLWGNDPMVVAKWSNGCGGDFRIFYKKKIYCCSSNVLNSPHTFWRFFAIFERNVRRRYTFFFFFSYVVSIYFWHWTRWVLWCYNNKGVKCVFRYLGNVERTH